MHKSEPVQNVLSEEQRVQFCALLNGSGYSHSPLKEERDSATQRTGPKMNRAIACMVFPQQ